MIKIKTLIENLEKENLKLFQEDKILKQDIWNITFYKDGEFSISNEDVLWLIYEEQNKLENKVLANLAKIKFLRNYQEEITDATNKQTC